MIDFSTGIWISKGSVSFTGLYAETPFTFSSRAILTDCSTSPSTDSYYLIGDSYQVFDVNSKNAVANWKPIHGGSTLLFYPETSAFKIGIFLKNWIQDCTINFWEFQQ